MNQQLYPNVSTYVRNPETIQAIQLENTPDSPQECMMFILGTGVAGGSFTRHSWGIRIVYSGGILCPNFGEYIVKTSLGNFFVFSKMEFEFHYTKASTGGHSGDGIQRSRYEYVSPYEKIEGEQQ